MTRTGASLSFAADAAAENGACITVLRELQYMHATTVGAAAGVEACITMLRKLQSACFFYIIHNSKTAKCTLASSIKLRYG